MSEPTRELLLGSDDLPFFTTAKGMFSVDSELVRVRIYSPDGRMLLADIGVSPARARAIGARFIAGANKIDPQGAVAAVETGGPAIATIGSAAP
jgi:hypothetical protein